jgi:hypothetical protein
VRDDGDVHSPHHNWSVSLSSASIASAYGFATLTGLDVLSRNGVGADGGRVLQLRVSGTNAGGAPVSTTVSGDDFRSRMGLRSNWYTFSAVDWSFETLDGAGGPTGRVDSFVGSDIATTLFGANPHVFYRDAAGGNLRHGWWSGTTWGFETLDGAGGPTGRIDASVGEYASAVNFGGNPHVFYYDGSSGNLRHAWWSGTTWGFETLDGAGGANGRTDGNVGILTSAVMFGGNPHVFYYDATNGNLRHAWWSGTTWGFETLDGAGGPTGRIDADLGLDSSVTLYGAGPHVFYYDASGGNLRHAWWSGTTWGFETLDGISGAGGRLDANVGRTTATTLYGAGPHVWYYDASGGDLRHAWWSGSAWGFETLDGAGGPSGRIDNEAGRFPTVTIYAGQPHVWYHGASDLRHGFYTGTAWGFETLDGAGGPGGRIASLAGYYNSVVLFGGQPHVFYLDATGGDLRHAWFS